MPAAPRLPAAAGPSSAALTSQLSGRVQDLTRVRPGTADPVGLDVQLSLYICYELFYQGFDGVDAGWEWDADLIGLRGRLEKVFLDHLRRGVGEVNGVPAADELRRLTVEVDVDAGGLGRFLRGYGTWQQLREYFVHRSIHRLKDADPQAWVIPRLTGQAKASLVAAEFDDYGAGHASKMSQRLFAELLAAAQLDDGYLAYLDAVPAQSLAVVNLMSMFGLHRELRAAAVGHFAAAEITSRSITQRLADALAEIGAPESCMRFYRNRVELAKQDGAAAAVVEELLRDDPELNDDVVFGIRAHRIMENRLADHMMKCWRSEESSLLRPLTRSDTAK
jgi:Iron-containing redox enzyme